MTRKAAARGRKGTAAGGGSGRAGSRATTRTGKTTASARASKPPARTPAERKPSTTNEGVARAVDLERKADEVQRDQVHAMHTEDDEDSDWLIEDEDPRSQIVEDEDDDWSPHHDDEW